MASDSLAPFPAPHAKSHTHLLHDDFLGQTDISEKAQRKKEHETLDYCCGNLRIGPTGSADHQGYILQDALQTSEPLRRSENATSRTDRTTRSFHALR